MAFRITTFLCLFFLSFPVLSQNKSKILNRIGEYYHFALKGVSRDFNKAKKYYLMAVDEGSAAAANHLGRLYTNGEGVLVDCKKASEWYQKSIDLDPSPENRVMNNKGFNYSHYANYLTSSQFENPHILNRLGEYHHFSKKDYTKAHDYYLKAVEKGSAAAANHLGRLYANGEGVKKNSETAKKWYSKSIQIDNSSRNRRLNTLSSTSFLCDLKKQSASTISLAIDSFFLGIVYENGLDGVKKDPGKAHAYYKKAIKSGFRPAAQNLVAQAKPGLPEGIPRT